MGNFLDCIAAREYIPLKKKSTKTKAKISARSLSKENILQAIEHAMNHSTANFKIYITCGRVLSSLKKLKTF
jgi:hypothetical protein